jgi:Tol biopolymer transport system component
MRIKNVISKWMLVLVISFLFSCQNPSVGLTPTSTYSPTPTHHSFIQTATPSDSDPSTVDTQSSVSSNPPDLTDLKQGQYLLVQSYQNGIPIHYVYSTDGEIVQKITIDANFSVSNGGTQLIMMGASSKIYYSLDLQTQEATSLNLDRDCYDANLSPDKQFVALSCLNDWTGDIYIFEKKSSTMVRITDCLEAAHSCYKPSWSPDGQWLAYYRNEEKSGTHTLDGVYLLNMTCKESGCKKQIGPILSDSNPTWSQNNELVVSEFGSINFFEVRDNSLILIRKNESGIENVASLSLSPDGEHMAFSPIDNSSIYIYTIASDTVEKLIELDHGVLLIGWIIK